MRGKRRRARAKAIALSASLIALSAATTASAATFKEYSVGSYPGQQPRYIKAGPDGNLWYADGGTEGGIGRISPTGELFTRFGGLGPVDIAFAPDGTAYWSGDRGPGRRSTGGAIEESTEWKLGYAAAISPSGDFWFGAEYGHWCESFYTKGEGCSEFQGLKGRITGLAFDRDGHAWAAFNEENQVRELESPYVRVDLPTDSRPSRIAIGPEGDLWVTMFDASAVDRITPAGERTRFPLTPGSGPNDIVLGPDGAFWITEYEADKIARVTTSGAVTGEFPVPTPGAHPTGIAAGPDGGIWFTEISTAKIGRLDPTAAAEGAPGGGGPGPSAGADVTAPKFTRPPAFSPARFRNRAARGTAASYLVFTISEAAELKLHFSRARPGRRAHGRCVAPSHANRAKRHCTRRVDIGTTSGHALAGADKIPFAPRIAGHLLTPGSYRVSVTATDAAGNGSAPATAGFTIRP